MDITHIIETIKLYYPPREEYDIDQFPTNSSYSGFPVHKCQSAEYDNRQWVLLLSNLCSLFKGSEAIDETMLVAYEPSYQCSLIIVSNSTHKIIYEISISVIAKYFCVHRKVYSFNPNLYNPNFFATEFCYSLKKEDKIYLSIIHCITSIFPGYKELPYYIALKAINDVVVPNTNSNEYPMICQCIFNSKIASN